MSKLGKLAWCLTAMGIDGGADEKELAIFKNIMRTNGFSPQDIELVYADIKGGNKGLYLRQLPTDYNEKVNFLASVVAILKADGKITNSELKVATTLGVALGFSAELCAGLLSTTKA